MIEEQQWDRVDVVTNGVEVINPVVPSLESMVAAGELPSNIHFHKVGGGRAAWKLGRGSSRQAESPLVVVAVWPLIGGGQPF